MKKRKILSIIVCALLVFMPYYVSAEPDEIEEPTPSPSASPSPTPSETPSVTPTPSPSPTPSATPDVKKSITLDQYKISLKANETFQLTASVNPNDSKIIWKSSDETVATVDSNGKIKAGTNSGNAIITATIDDSEIKAECKVEVDNSSDATLKSIVVSNGKLDKDFKSDVFNYSVTIDKDTSKLEFKTELTNIKAKYFGLDESKNKNLKNGDKLELKVVSEDGKVNNIYTLTIVKDTTSLNLKSLKITGYALNEVFSSDKLQYSATIPNEIEVISVEAFAEDSNTSIKIAGDKDLKVGNNIVTITVTDDSGNSRIYQITVTRGEKSVVEENTTSIITSRDTTNSDNSDTNSGSNNKDKNNNDANKDDFLKYAIVSVSCFILFLIGGIGIYFYLKTSPKKLKKQLKQEKSNENPMNENETLESDSDNHSNISEIMDEKLIETREFKREDLNPDNDSDNLFDDKDV